MEYDLLLKAIEKMLDEKLQPIKKDIDYIKSVQKEHGEILYSLRDQLNDLDSKNAKNHLESISKINALTDSVDFLKYEDLRTREEVFSVKKYLNIVK